MNLRGNEDQTIIHRPAFLALRNPFYFSDPSTMKPVFLTSIASLACRTALAALMVLGMIPAGHAAQAGPWDLTTLRKAPAATWGQSNGLVREVYYAGEPFQGKATRVFAYYGCPEGKGPFPAVVLLHGGGGTAFPEWARQWAARGYASLAMDLSGNGPAGRLPDGGPMESDDVIFRDFTDTEAREMWTYHAVAAAMRGASLLASRPEVDARRMAITGISWGGYLTCIVAGLDERFKAAVPVYGCGFIHENSHWVQPRFMNMSGDQRKRWVTNFDPSRYLGRVKCPMLFVNGTCDFAYPLDSYQKSYSLVRSPVTLAVQINRPHGHHFNFKEVDAFIDSHLTDGKPLPKLGAMKIAGSTVSATVTTAPSVTKAELNYTTDSGPWQQRVWKSAPAEMKGNTVSAQLPNERPLVYYLVVTDERGLTVSTPHAELQAKEMPH
jgi:dienelactone hydrolase